MEKKNLFFLIGIIALLIISLALLFMASNVLLGWANAGISFTPGNFSATLMHMENCAVLINIAIVLLIIAAALTVIVGIFAMGFKIEVSSK